MTETTTLLEGVQRLLAQAQRLTHAAETARDLKTALSGIAQVRGCLQLLGEVSGKLSRPGVSIEFNFKFANPQEAREKLQRVIDHHGLQLTILETEIDRAANEKRIAELLTQLGPEGLGRLLSTGG